MDTLVKSRLVGVDWEDPTLITGYRSLEKIHGIKSEWLNDAPTFDEVQEHIMMLQTGTFGQDRKVLGDLQVEGANEEQDPRSIFVGHGIITDLKVLDLQHTLYQCTQIIDQDPNTKKLKDLASKYLNASI